MNSGRLEYGGGSRTLCEFSTRSIYADYQGGVPRIYASFSPEKTFPINIEGVDYNSFAAINCYGYSMIAGVNVGYIKGPSFFRMLPGDIKFVIDLTKEQVSLIESKRNFGDVEINLELKVLVSFNTDFSYLFNYVLELPLWLSARINKSVWIEEFLPKWEFFSSSETILILPNLSKYPTIRKHLEQARRSCSQNNCDDTLVSCYKALEALPIEYGFKNPKLFFNHLREVIDTKSIMYGKVEKIDALYGSIKGLMHIARHIITDNENSMVDVEINHSDAKIALHCTELIINYLLDNILAEDIKR